MPIEGPPLKIEELEGFAFEDDDEVLAELEDEVLAELDLQAQPQELAPPPPPSPPAAKQPAPNWTIYGFIYEVKFPRFQKIASIFLATGPQYPRGGGPEGSSLVQFWWPEGRDGFHGRSSRPMARAMEREPTWTWRIDDPFQRQAWPYSPPSRRASPRQWDRVQRFGLSSEAHRRQVVQCLVGDGELHARAA